MITHKSFCQPVPTAKSGPPESFTFTVESDVLVIAGARLLGGCALVGRAPFHVALLALLFVVLCAPRVLCCHILGMFLRNDCKDSLVKGMALTCHFHGRPLAA